MSKRTPINKLWAEKPAAPTGNGEASQQDGVIASHQDSSATGPAAPRPAVEKRKGQTLRLTRDAWKQLKLLAIEHDRTAHDLLIEAVNDLFRKHGRPPIA